AMSSGPRWTPSAAAASATSTRSLTTKGTPDPASAALIARAVATIALVSLRLSRNCTSVAPPSTTRRASTTISCPPARSGSMMALRRRSTGFILRMLRNLPFFGAGEPARNDGAAGFIYKLAVDASEARMVPFFVQIKCQLGKSYEVANRLADAEIASEIYSTAGDFDLLVKFYVDQATDIGH